MEIDPGQVDFFSNFLFTISYYALYPRHEILLHHKRWDAIHGRRGNDNRFTHPETRTPKQRLKIGYVSSDFRQHPVNNFFAAIIANHDQERFPVHCYSNVVRPDAITEKIKAQAAVWRSIVGMDDEAAARLIKDDGIDILVDPAGHTKGNRLPVFTYKPAPIQVTYLGYCTTTGLQAMDYWITDPLLTPKGGVEKTVERIITMPDAWVCYTPSQRPKIQLSDREQPDAVVFGSFNNLSKINATVAALWSRICLALPESRLLLKAPQLADPKERERVYSLFGRYGVKKNRIMLRPATSDYLQEYGLMDIALDPFPRTGGVTTADALWMGVPVITLSGGSMMEQQGTSLLSVIGKTCWIAENADDYVQKAVELGKNGVRDTNSRLSLHNTVTDSPLCDYKGFTENLEALYHRMWLAPPPD